MVVPSADTVKPDGRLPIELLERAQAPVFTGSGIDDVDRRFGRITADVVNACRADGEGGPPHARGELARYSSHKWHRHQWRVGSPRRYSRVLPSADSRPTRPPPPEVTRFFAPSARWMRQISGPLP